MINKCALVRSTCKFVCQRAKHVTISEDSLKKLAERYELKPFNQFPHHHTPENLERGLLQMFMLDSMNFCFWPLENFEYDNLATHIQRSVEEGIKLQELSQLTQEQLVHKIFHGTPMPMAQERARILREMSSVILQIFGGSFVSLIEKANKSAVTLLNILTQNFLNFQDHSIYEGHQIHFYKRGQILIKDIHGRFNGTGIGQFKDIDELTMFPDYRVPQVFQAENVFIYSEHLRKIIHSKQVITDRNLEIELRAGCVIAVQKMKEHLKSIGKNVTSCEIDWFLWNMGETRLAELQPHHRCLTIYY